MNKIPGIFPSGHDGENKSPKLVKNSYRGAVKDKTEGETLRENTEETHLRKALKRNNIDASLFIESSQLLPCNCNLTASRLA